MMTQEMNRNLENIFVVYGGATLTDMKGNPAGAEVPTVSSRPLASSLWHSITKQVSRLGESGEVQRYMKRRFE